MTHPVFFCPLSAGFGDYYSLSVVLLWTTGFVWVAYDHHFPSFASSEVGLAHLAGGLFPVRRGASRKRHQDGCCCAELEVYAMQLWAINKVLREEAEAVAG